MKKYIFQGWKGSYIEAYFDNIDEEGWVTIHPLRFLILWIGGYHVRIIDEYGLRLRIVRVSGFPWFRLMWSSKEGKGRSYSHNPKP